MDARQTSPVQPQSNPLAAVAFETARRFVGRHGHLIASEDHDDQVQNACVSILEAGGKFRAGRCSPETFGWQVAHRRMIDRWRRLRTKPAITELPPEHESGINFSDDLIQVVDRSLSAAEILLGGKMGQGRTFPLYRLCACLIVREYTRQSHRAFEMMMHSWPELRSRFGMTRTPTRMTLHWARRAIKTQIKRRSRAPHS
jgi:hypothetical protein